MTLQHLQLNLTGLKVEGLSDSKTEKLVFEVTKNYLKKNKDDISERIASDLQQKLNRKLKGVSSAKIISMLKGA